MNALLQVDDIAQSYGGVQAVAGVSFELAEGEILALIGPNGAGKSTCFNMLNGQIRPDRGTIRIAGRPTTGLPPRTVWRYGVGRTFQIAATFGSMTVAENVTVALLSHHRGLSRWWGRAAASHRAEALRLLALVGMADSADRASAELAYGDSKRLELAIALANRPKLLLMDEPTAGMAARERIALMQLTARIAREEHIGVLFTEHDMDVVFEHADRVLVLSRGSLIAAGAPEAVRQNADVRAVYLGDGLTYDPRHQGGVGQPASGAEAS